MEEPQIGEQQMWLADLQVVIVKERVIYQPMNNLSGKDNNKKNVIAHIRILAISIMEIMSLLLANTDWKAVCHWVKTILKKYQQKHTGSLHLLLIITPMDTIIQACLVAQSTKPNQLMVE